MQDYLLDDDFFDELIKKDQLSSENIQVEIMQEEKVKAVNIVKVDEPIKVTEVKSPAVNLESSENTKMIEMVCGFKSKRICNSTCKYFSSCSRRPDKGSGNSISAHNNEFIKKESIEKGNLEVKKENEKETVDSMLDKYYRWLLAEGFMEMPAQNFVGIMRNYHEFSVEDGKDSPLLVFDNTALKERFQKDNIYIPKLMVRVGKTKVDSAKKYYISFMKEYCKKKYSN